MSDIVIAKKFTQLECGKHVENTKKKFIWLFNIGHQNFELILTSSLLSGKKIVTLNSAQIYSQKNLLNINFDFTHRLNDHILRISKVQDTVHNFTLRIDNKQFDELTEQRNIIHKIEYQNNKKNQIVDPFSDFSSFAKIPSTKKTKDQFGEFDFDNFNFQKPQEKKSTIKRQSFQHFNQVPRPVEKNIFDMDNFQTNTGTFAQKFKQNQEDLLSADIFATNAYGVNNNYLDLHQSKDAPSHLWSATYMEENAPKKWTDKMKIDMTAKQIGNKIKMTFQQTKQKIVQFTDSLI